MRALFRPRALAVRIIPPRSLVAECSRCEFEAGLPVLYRLADPERLVHPRMALLRGH